MVPKILFLVLLGAALVLANPVAKENGDSTVGSQESIEGKVEEVNKAKWYTFNKIKKSLTFISDKFAVFKEKGGKVFEHLGEFFEQSKKCLKKLKDVLIRSGEEGKELYDILTKDEKEAENTETPKQ